MSSSLAIYMEKNAGVAGRLAVLPRRALKWLNAGKRVGNLANSTLDRIHKSWASAAPSRRRERLLIKRLDALTDKAKAVGTRDRIGVFGGGAAAASGLGYGLSRLLGKSVDEE